MAFKWWGVKRRNHNARQTCRTSSGARGRAVGVVALYLDLSTTLNPGHLRTRLVFYYFSPNDLVNLEINAGNRLR